LVVTLLDNVLADPHQAGSRPAAASDIRRRDRRPDHLRPGRDLRRPGGCSRSPTRCSRTGSSTASAARTA